MLGTIASEKNYICVDSNEVLIEELNKMANWLKTFNKNEIIIKWNDSIIII